MNFAEAEIVNGPTLQRARGIGRIAAKQVGERTRLATLFQEGCGKIRLPNTHSSNLEAVLINTAGGITGGDHLQWSADMAPGGHMVLTTQACERSYRSTGDFGRVETRLKVGAGGHLDWLPQETILFAASKLDRHLEVDLDEGATLTAIEAILLGRDAMGEDAADALLRDNWRIRRNGRLVHAEATAIAPLPVCCIWPPRPIMPKLRGTAFAPCCRQIRPSRPASINRVWSYVPWRQPGLPCAV